MISRLVTRLDTLLEYIAKGEVREEKLKTEMVALLRTISAQLRGLPPAVLAPPVKVPPIEVITTTKTPTVAKAVPIVVPKPEAPIVVRGKVTTTDSYKVVGSCSYTINDGKRFQPAKVIVSCPEDVMFKLVWQEKDVSIEYYVMAKLPFTDWFPWNYLEIKPGAKALYGDGKSKLELHAKYPSGGTPAEVHAEISGEEV